MPELFTNNARSTLSVNAGAGATEFTLADASLFPEPANPDDFFVFTIFRASDSAWEVIRCESRAGNVLSDVTRNYEDNGTGPLAFVAGDIVEHCDTAGVAT